MRYAILTDLHANFSALKAVEGAVQILQGRAPERIQFWCLGDVVGYGPSIQAVECLKWVQRYCRNRWIFGNHDEWLFNFRGEASVRARLTLLHQRILLETQFSTLWEWFAQQATTLLTGETVRFEVCESSALPDDESPQVTGASLSLVLTHASAQPGFERSTYLYPWIPSALEGDLKWLLTRRPEKNLVLFHGHTHYPVFAHLEAGKLRFQSIRYGVPLSLGEGAVAINPGSVGQPRDGDSRAAFVLLDTEARTVEFHRVKYEVRETLDALKTDQETWVNTFEQYLAQTAGSETPTEAGGATPKLVHQLLEASKNHHSDSRLANKILKAHTELLRTLQTADGSVDLLEYRAKVYRVPQWDLEAVE